MVKRHMTEPKIQLKIEGKKGINVRKPSRRKLIEILRDASLARSLRIDASATLRVVYGKDREGVVIDNKITTRSVDDLVWASRAFLDRDLYL